MQAAAHPAPAEEEGGSWQRFRRQALSIETKGAFLGDDITVGIENEYQVAVEGCRNRVDLPLAIADSRYFRNLVRRAARGDFESSAVEEIESFLGDEESRIWENSWVRFPRNRLSSYACSILEHDLQADKTDPQAGRRKDCGNFQFVSNGAPWLRIPLSYLLKLSLADAISRPAATFPGLFRIGRALMRHFISDNTSPEITSFLVTGSDSSGKPGDAAARETCRRFLLVQLLLAYANSRFALQRHGQKCLLYPAPSPPLNQRRLNDLISDGFYRELFLNPCLSGWSRGEEKLAYMGLCHRILSRSRLNAISRLREAGIITNNLVVLPNTSDTSLANNGTHISQGSGMLSRIYAALPEMQGQACEKYFGDLTVKAMEHFLPLFVGTVSAAPSRLRFNDFHPERALGFLPHELDHVHLRMIWRRWKKKALLRRMGHAFTPLGPQWLDRMIGHGLRLHGDYLPDVRLIDYLVALQSVEENPALDGGLGNQERLKQDLASQGVFDPRMAMYLPCRQRMLHNMGFSGFEGRWYSLFPDLLSDLALAVDLQSLVLAVAHAWVCEGRVCHRDLPDDPFTESERRQFFFAAAIGLPTVYVRSKGGNRLLMRILARTKRVRHSRRYPGYLRVELPAYRSACLELLGEEAVRLGVAESMGPILAHVGHCLSEQGVSAAERLTERITGPDKSPLAMEGMVFNRAAEALYRTEINREHMVRGLEVLIEDGRSLDREGTSQAGRLCRALCGLDRLEVFFRGTGREAIQGTATEEDLHRLILLTLAVIDNALAHGGRGEREP